MKHHLATPLALLVTAFVLGTFGCELVASIDRGKIPSGEAGGTTTSGAGGAGQGGQGGTATGGSGGSGPGGGGSGGGVCDAPTDCPDPGSECVTRTCVDGACGTEPVAAGTPSATQTQGDCKVSQCDGAGALEDAADDADLPDDSNDCTDDVCTAGVPSNPFVASGDSCAMGGGSFCDGAGSCVECLQPSDCPGQDTECHSRTCDAGVCGVANAAPGANVSSQSAGDCKKNQCDGNGAIESVPDDTDVEDDGNDCTINTCNAGTTVTTNAVIDTPCGAGGALKCNGAGACVGCNDASQCGVPANECLQATCIGNACGTANVLDGTTCDDGDACSQVDTCQAGSCTGSSPVVCSAQDQCHDVGTCDSATGTCSSPAKADGVACLDGNGCTQSDTCQAGTCTGANPVVCSALDQCHDAGVCDAGTGVCSNPNKPNGAACSDGDACTQSDTCQAGACTGANPVVCSALDQCHDAGTCNSATGVCSNPSKPNGAACSDGDACTQSDTCQAGACTGANPVVCSALDQCHDAGTCNSATGVCSNPSKPNGAACSDGNACTQTDTCQAGACTGANPVVCSALNQCHDAGTCNSATGVCSNPNKPNGAACSDGNACTQTDTCQAGACTGANPVVCVQQDQCHDAGTCNSATGVCSNPSKPNGAACNDGVDCTISDACTAGVCGGVDAAAGAACDDNGGAVCDGAGACVQCNVASDCPGVDDECKTRTCSAGTCGLSFAPSGTIVAGQVAGDCHQNQCDGAGNIASVVLDTDVPVDGNQCTNDVCTAGFGSNPALGAGAACSQNGGTKCDGAGACVECLAAAECPGVDTECQQRSCSGGVCGMDFQPNGTAVAAQTAGDCHENQCDGAGNVVDTVHDADVPVDGNGCTDDICLAGLPLNPSSSIGSSCADGGGNACDGAGACIRTIMVMRYGDGSAALNATATAAFIEERRIDGTAFLAPIAMPTAVSGSNFRFTVAATSASEGGLSRSLDGHYVLAGGYDADLGTAALAGTTAASVQRVIGRVDRAHAVDTSTKLATAFNASNIRSVCSSNGVDLWAAGNSTGVTGGIWRTTLGSTGAGVQILATPSNVRFCHVFFGQLYGSSGSNLFLNVFSVGSGLPTTNGQTATVLTGLPNVSGQSPYSYVFFDVNADGVADLLYVADDRAAAATGGVYKYTSADGINWVAGTPALTNVGASNGARGLAGFLSAGVVTLFATTTQTSANNLFTLVDDLTGAAMVTTSLAPAGANTVFRGVALGPR